MIDKERRVYAYPMWGSTVRDAGCCRLEYIRTLVCELTENVLILDRAGSIHPRRLAIQSKIKSVKDS